MGVLLTHIIVNITISEHEELTRTVNAVSESKIYIKEGLENTVVCHFPMLENAHF